MRRVASLFFVLLLAVMLSGCSGSRFKIPKDEYLRQVQTLGVLPLLLDEGSTITLPDRAEVIEVLRRQNSMKEGRLVELLRDQKAYFDVRSIDGDPRQFYGRLIRGSSLQGKGGAIYRSYRFDPQAAGELCRRHLVDAVLVLVVNGVVRPEKRWDRTHLSFLETSYNSVLVTAAVVRATGEVVWEWGGVPGESFLPLQYPDFDESHYNMTDQVRVKNISVAGLERTLAEPDRNLFGKASFSRLYRELFDQIATALHPGMYNLFKPRSPAAGGDVSQ